VVLGEVRLVRPQPSLVGIRQIALTEAIRVFSSQRVAPAGEYLRLSVE